MDRETALKRVAQGMALIVGFGIPAAHLGTSDYYAPALKALGLESFGKKE